MTDLTALASTRDALHQVTAHIVARARQQATGRISLRAASGGLSTPDFGPDGRRVRIADGNLIVESESVDAPQVIGRPIDGATMRELAGFAAVDLDAPLDVGTDTPTPIDPDQPIVIDAASADLLARWWTMSASALDRVVVTLTSSLPAGAITLPRLWPEHFDVAIEVDLGDGVHVNLGGAPGDGFSAEPYVYVGPWSADRPGDPSFWNVPFGSMRTMSDLGWPADAAGAAERVVAFLLDGAARLTPTR